MKLLLFLTYIALARSNIMDVIEATNGHEPRIAINCGKIPFYIDLESGAWIADSDSKVVCDQDKEDVKKYCQQTYKHLNISNIVEANQPVTFNNWCEPGLEQCNEAKKVVPYRCLVNEYEADALMVPDGCNFDHIHDEQKCLTHDEWKKKAQHKCKKNDMKLKDYGILLSCGTDKFTGVEYVCCPRKHNKQNKHGKKHQKKRTQKQFAAAIRKFQTYMPLETKGCDRSTYLTKQTAMEDRHRNQIAAIVDEWDEAEQRYKQLKLRDEKAADEKMKRTLEVFRQTLAALEEESNSEKNRLRAEHADCINTQISFDKRKAMVAYLAAIEEKPADAEKILETVRKFIQVCEHDRVHSLRHFEHVRNRDEKKAEAIRGDLLQHLKDLNKIVNESMSLLNYLPDIAQKFGIGDGAVLKPKKDVPEDEHIHGRVDEILEEASKKYEEEEEEAVETTTPTPTTTTTTTEAKVNKMRENIKKVIAVIASKKTNPPKTTTEDRKPTDAIPETEVKPTQEVLDKEVEEDYDFTKKTQEEEKEREDARENFEDTKRINELLSKFSDEFDRMTNDDDDDDDKKKTYQDDAEDDEANLAHQQMEKDEKERQHKGGKPSTYLTVVLGLSCGVVVVMMFIVIAMVMRRRVTKTRVIIAENNDEREHLVEMQKNGFENPTYKFFYY